MILFLTFWDSVFQFLFQLRNKNIVADVKRQLERGIDTLGSSEIEVLIKHLDRFLQQRQQQQQEPPTHNEFYEIDGFISY